jgi:CBS domain containing-hemolysin-like protein
VFWSTLIFESLKEEISSGSQLFIDDTAAAAIAESLAATTAGSSVTSADNNSLTWLFSAYIFEQILVMILPELLPKYSAQILLQLDPYTLAQLTNNPRWVVFHKLLHLCVQKVDYLRKRSLINTKNINSEYNACD